MDDELKKSIEIEVRRTLAERELETQKIISDEVQNSRQLLTNEAQNFRTFLQAQFRTITVGITVILAVGGGRVCFPCWRFHKYK